MPRLTSESDEELKGECCSKPRNVGRNGRSYSARGIVHRDRSVVDAWTRNRYHGEIRGRARQAEAVTWSGALWLTAETLLGVLLLD